MNHDGADREREFAGLSRDEEVLVRTRRHAVALAERLVREPFAVTTQEAARGYYDQVVVAGRVWREWQQLPPQQLRDRLLELLAGEEASS